MRAKVTKANGTDLDADENVGIVNNFLHSLFKQVDVFLKMYFNAGNDVSRTECSTGYAVYAVYAFDLSADMCGLSPHFNVVQKGSLTVDN